MKYLVCAAEDCKQPFEPAFGQEETQKFCSIRCRNRDGVRRYRQRHRAKPNGGGPGGGKQPLLFSRSEMRRRKPAKSSIVAKPKQDALFPASVPADIASWFAGLTAEQRQEVARIVAEAKTRGRGEGAVSDNGNSEGEQIFCKLLPAHLRKPSQSVIAFLREAARAA